MSNCNFSTGTVPPTVAPVSPATHFDSVSGFTYNWNLGTQTWVPVPKVYRALLHQTGTVPPTVIVLENTLGATVTWTRSAAGVYIATPTPAAFTTHKTAVMFPFSVPSAGTVDWYVGATLTVETRADSFGLIDSVLDFNFLEILVYP